MEGRRSGTGTVAESEPASEGAPRVPAVADTLEDLLRQRVYQIAGGYEDQNDADHLRTDLLLALVCGWLPEADLDLASQTTFSWLENAFSAPDCYRLALALNEAHLRERERIGIPRRVVLDLDSTDDPTHGDQEGSADHGYYRQHMYHPLLASMESPVGSRVDRPANRRRARGHDYPGAPRGGGRPKGGTADLGRRPSG